MALMIGCFRLLAPLNATEVSSATSAGPDISDWSAAGYPGAGLLNANEKYFW